MTQDLKEFRASILKLKDKRIHKVNNSIGVYDIYKMIRKNKWLDIGQPLTEHQFYYIIRTINNYLADRLIQGKDITLPCRMGRLELRKYNANISIVDGKVTTNLPIDWNETLKLWEEDELSFKNRTLIKQIEDEIFKVYYNKAKSLYTNSGFYTFNINRDIKRKLKMKIKNKEIDAYEMGRVTY